MRCFLELHVDDVLLSRDPFRWPEVARLLDRVATIAENEGAALSFRVRAWFAEGDVYAFLKHLERRGHEVGAHAHGRDLRRGVAALRRGGIDPQVMAPGLVQVGDRGRLKLLRVAQSLGASVITDRLESRHFSYQGWLPWEPLPGLRMLDISVSPFEWGVLQERDGKVVPAWGRLDWAALDRYAAKAESWPEPPGRRAFFGATFHEHDLCPEGTLAPLALDGLSRWCARWRPARSAECG